MKTSPILANVAVFAVLSASTIATPQQPWSEYKVHDMERPQPPKVETRGAILKTPPTDAIVLFNGLNADAFTVPWTVENGILTATKSDTKTKQSFGKCQLHIEWRIPKGAAANGNSGLYLMDLYEVQILESHDHVSYADGMAGAIYGQTPPLVNASQPAGKWQSYDIVFTPPVYGENGVETPAAITVIHNGVVIHNHQTIFGPSLYQQLPTYPKTHPEKAPIKLQWHGAEVQFRNIWVREL